MVDPVWSPTGEEIAFTHRVKVEDGQAQGGFEEPFFCDEEGEYESDVLSYRRLKHKWNGEGYWDGKWRHIFKVSVEGGEPQQLTEGEYEHSSPAWSPDGKQIAFSADRRHFDAADVESKSDIYVLDLEDDKITQLTDNKGPATTPVWAPDGKKIAYFGHLDQYGSASLTRLWIVETEGEEGPRCVSESFDRNLGRSLASDLTLERGSSKPIWDKAGEGCFVTYVDQGTGMVGRFDIDEREMEIILDGKRAFHSISFDENRDQLVAIVTDPSNPGEVIHYDLNQQKEQILTAPNEDLLAELQLSEPKGFTYSGADGWEMEGWFMEPSVKTGEEYPLIVKIHGGPHGAYGYSFSHHSQLLAAAGYAVLFVNPRGSIGYGQKFAKATHLDWGGGDYEDIMAGLDYLLDSEEAIDEERIGVTGASFGGYMTNWIIGQNDRFAAAVSEISTSNRYSQWGVSDYGFGNGKWEFKGYPWASWENTKQYMERSPITYVENVDTPVLLIQGKEDHRCPLEQAEQFYTALRVLQKEVELVIFPDESHGFSRMGKPRHREERLLRIMSWFDKHLE